VPIRWLPANLEPSLVVQHASLISELALRAEKAIQDLDPMNDWTFLRVRSHKHEIMVCPEKEFMMIVLQDPNVKEHGKVDDGAAAK
jgi:dynein light chain roadblock-type